MYMTFICSFSNTWSGLTWTLGENKSYSSLTIDENVGGGENISFQGLSVYK